MLLSERMGAAVSGNSNDAPRPEAEELRNQIRQSLMANKAQEQPANSPVTVATTPLPVAPVPASGTKK